MNKYLHRIVSGGMAFFTVFSLNGPYVVRAAENEGLDNYVDEYQIGTEQSVSGGISCVASDFQIIPIQVDASGNATIQICVTDLQKVDCSVIDKVQIDVIGDKTDSVVHTYEAVSDTQGKYIADIRASDWPALNTEYTIKASIHFQENTLCEPLYLEDYHLKLSEILDIQSTEEIFEEAETEATNEPEQSIISHSDVLSVNLNITPRIQAVLSADEKTAVISTEAMTELEHGQSLRFGVWSDANGQDDLRWYEAEYQNGIYTSEIAIADFKSLGSYTVHCYLFNAENVGQFQTGTQFKVSSPSVEKIMVGEINNATGDFLITANNLTAKSGIARVRAAVWSRDDQSNIHWYEMNRQSNDTYAVTANMVNHSFASGNYTVHIYVEDGNGFYVFAGGAKKDIEVDESRLYISTENQKQYTFTIRAFEGYENVTEIRFGVWSAENGQDDLRWYTAALENGVYTRTVSISDHGSLGQYTVHCYAVDRSGAMKYIDGGNFTVESPALKEVTVQIPDTALQDFQINLNGLVAPSGIQKVEVAVWSTADQSDLKWYTLPGQSGENYQILTSLSNHGSRLGTYTIHVYVTDGNGIKTFAGEIKYTFQISCDTFTASVNKSNSTVTATMAGLKTFGIAEKVRFGVWSSQNGQDDLTWYDAEWNGNEYISTIDLKTFDDGGEFVVHAYAADQKSNQYFVGGTTFYVNGITDIGEVQEGEFSLRLTNIDSDYTGISAEIWTGTDADNKKTYRLQIQNDGTYATRIPLKDFEYYMGTYHLEIYGNSDSGEGELIETCEKEININRGSFAAVISSDSGLRYTAVLENTDLLGIAEEVRFGVWSEENGQDDLVWYIADENDGTYSVDIPLMNHAGAGKYTIHAYYKLPNDNLIYLNGTTFDVQSVPSAVITASEIDGSNGTFVLTGELGQMDIAVSKISVGVWYGDHAAVWYDMEKQGDGTYQAVVDVQNHQYYFGEYTAHMYVETPDAQKIFAAGTHISIQADNYIRMEDAGSGLKNITIYGANVNGMAVTSVRFPTWSDNGNQDDLVWYDAVENGDGSYSVQISRSNHKRSGAYTTHIYLYIDSVPYMVGMLNYSMYYSGEFDDHAKEVMHNIIFAVETGGQIYGNARYSDFTEAYTNSDRETAITIGAGAWFATEAKRLLSLIREEDPITFAALDTAGIGYDLDTADWSTYGGDGNGNPTILKGSAKALCIQAIISTDTGIKIQNRLVDEQMEQYVQEAADLGVTDLKAQMFCANVRHLGGYGPMEWVVECCIEDGKALTMENIYTSMRDHTPNKAGNGVGADKYNTRHQKVMQWINEYID